MPTNFSAACKKFFGYMEGQTLTEFGKELGALTPTDKIELATMLSEQLGDAVIVTTK